MSRSVLTAASMAVVLAATTTACRQAADSGEGAADLSLPAPRAEDSADSAITLVPPDYERAAGGLTYLFHVASDVFGTVDPIDGEVVFLGENGEQLGVARLPDGFEVRDVDIGESIVLRGDHGAVAIPRSGAIPAELKSIRLPTPSSSVTRHGRALRVAYKSPGKTTDLLVAPLGRGRVLAVTFVGFDRAGNPYAYWEEGAGKGVESWVGRFGKDGKLDAAARLDFSDFADIPAVPVAVTPAATVLLMHPQEESIELIELTLRQGFAGEVKEQLVGAPRVKVLDVGDSTPEVVDLPYDPGRVRKAPAHDAAFGAAAVERAKAFLDARWPLRPPNFQQPGLEHNCEPEQGLYWARPTRLSEEKLGQAVRAVPYKWGGFDSVAQFQLRLSSPRPALAGDVCTCREARFNGCIVDRAAGIDCSGFVSRAWGLKEHVGTYGLAKMATPLPSLFDLKPGDILNRPGNHVRLFVRFEPGPEVRIRTLESAVSCGGVCERVYTPAQLQFYRPMRLR